MVRLGFNRVTIWSTTCFFMIFASPNFTLKLHHAFRDVHFGGIKKGNIRWMKKFLPSRMIQYSLKVSVVQVGFNTSTNFHMFILFLKTIQSENHFHRGKQCHATTSNPQKRHGAQPSRMLRERRYRRFAKKCWVLVEICWSGIFSGEYWRRYRRCQLRKGPGNQIAELLGSIETSDQMSTLRIAVSLFAM